MSRYPEHAGIPVAPNVKFDIVEFADEYHVDPMALALYLADNHITEEEGAIEFFSHFEESYVGWFEDGLYDLANELAAEHVPPGSWVEGYVDIDRVVRDLEADGWHSELGHIFRPA